MPWTDEQVEQLRQMWVEGLSANEIAKRIGVSKNSIVGKVHRLCLQARPSPIKRKNSVPAQQPLQNEGIKDIPSTEEVKEEQAEISALQGMPVKDVKKNCGKNTVRLVELDSHTCRWPIGDPRDEDFCFCGKKVRTGQTYCDEHSAVAYVKATKK